MRQEIVLFIMGGVFVMETVSVMLQVASFKLTGKRIFRMAPIHHHFELKGWAEPEGHRALLDHFRDPGAGRACDVEGALTMTPQHPISAPTLACRTAAARTCASSSAWAARACRARVICSLAASSFAVTDSRAAPPEASALAKLAPDGGSALRRFR